jgi:Holliday junction resolvasome RuvABC DNA-binding subunit
MKRNEIDGLIRKLNEFRMANLNKSFTGAELNEALVALGFKSYDASRIAQKCFPFEYMGKNRLYEVPKEPIHKSILISINNKATESVKKCQAFHKAKVQMELTEEAALAALQAKGYQIRKCVGFDLERFAKENPVLYKKYLKYEII